MKKYIVSLSLTALAGLFCSCGNSFLEEKPQNFEAPENIYINTPGFQAAINGLYAQVRTEFSTWDVPAALGATNYEALQVGLDICARGKKDDSLLGVAELYTMDPAHQFTRARWKWAYAAIANANQIINRAEDEAVKWTSAGDKENFQAQARFLRAYLYRYLVYLYGDVPWIDKIEDQFRTDFTRDPKSLIISKMIEDLEFAATYLEDDPDAIKQGELTVWTAKHLLSEIYSLAGDYQKAKNAALEVINSGKYALMQERFGVKKNEVGDVFADMFLENNHNRSSGNMESIWVIQAEYNKQGGSGDIDWTRRAWVPRYENVDGFVNSVEYGGRGLGQIYPLHWLLDSYEADDIRNSNYNIRRDWYYNKPGDPRFGQKFEFDPENNPTHKSYFDNGYFFYSTTKFDYGVAGNENGLNGVFKDKTRFRLAETYLLLAEACLGLNDKQGAADAINEVRSRAKATPVAVADVDLDYLLDERARELLGEEIRRFTLSRTGQILNRTRAKNPVSGSNITEKDVLWPVPQEVIDANSGVKWENNPGYY